MLSSHAISPQNGAMINLLLSIALHKSEKVKQISIDSVSSFFALKQKKIRNLHPKCIHYCPVVSNAEPK